MAKIFSIAVALAAILFVAYALPRPQDEGGEEVTTAAPPAEGGEGEGEGGESTTQNPCAQFQEQCSNNGGQVDNGAGGQGNMTQGNSPPPASAQCQALQQQCGAQQMTPPGGQTIPGGVTQPAMTQPTQPGMTQPTQPSMNMTTPTPELNQNTTIPGLGIGRR